MFQIELTKWKHIPQIPLKWWLISLQSPTQPVSSVTAGGGFSRGSVIEDRVWCRSGGDARHLGSKLESDDQSMSPAAAMRRDRRQVWHPSPRGGGAGGICKLPGMASGKVRNWCARKEGMREGRACSRCALLSGFELEAMTLFQVPYSPGASWGRMDLPNCIFHMIINLPPACERDGPQAAAAAMLSNSPASCCFCHHHYYVITCARNSIQPPAP
jgi:hypothetical protein